MVGDRTLMIVKGLSRFGVNFGLAIECLRFLASSQTLLSLAKGVNPWLLCEDITWWVSSCAARASSQAVKTSFTLEVTLRKSRVEGGWDLASPYVVHPCLHTQWSHILGFVRGGDKDLSRGVNKPVRVGPSRLLE